MMVLFVSQSEKKAIKKSQQVLDAFANRIGDNTWQTIITKEGLDMVKKLLRKSSSKNTAVSCHWIRSRQTSELLWIVGNKNKFDEDGKVPVNSTQKNILRYYQENNWYFLPLIQALSAVAALLHDLGKASLFFQDKLKKQKRINDPFRHELISALIVQGMYRYYLSQGKELLSALATGECPRFEEIIPFCRNKELELKLQYRPFKDNSSVIICSILWLILTHHRLPTPLNEFGEEASYNTFSEGAPTITNLFSYITTGLTYRQYKNDENLFKRELEQCFLFFSDISQFSEIWRKELKKWSGRLKGISEQILTCSNNGSLRMVLKYARLSLMLGDHFYSSLNSDVSWNTASPVYANTAPEQHGILKQKLDEHLNGVKTYALKVSHYLPFIEKNMPSTEIVRELKRKSAGRFAWQDKAYDAIKIFKISHPDFEGAFILNLAGTGCGKTTANAKIAAILGTELGRIRFTLALGLRTLTLQTGDEYRKRLRLREEDVAIVIGSSSIQFMHDLEKKYHEENKRKNETEYNGSESTDNLFDYDTYYEGELPNEGFSTLFKNSKATKLLYAPVLCCTIDQMMSATECCRGGRYMIPFLRLMSSDLVIDEVDDFTGNDLKAIGRLVYLCGSLGRRIVLSSATLPPEIATAFFLAYKEGYRTYCTLRKKRQNIMLVWVNEHECKTETYCCDSSDQKKFYEMHSKFTNGQALRLKNETLTKIGSIFECPLESIELKKRKDIRDIYFENILQAALKLHNAHHMIDIKSRKEISFGVIRLANIDPCVAATKYLCKCTIPDDTEIRVMVYHSRQTLLLRHEQEHYLDSLLKRDAENTEDPTILHDPLVRKHIEETISKKLLFIVVCTPVEEVGRDHDYDWAVIEPSSWRSIVQMAGRVNRHRSQKIDKPNVIIMQYNYNCFLMGDKKNKSGQPMLFYRNPGYERYKPAMNSHNLNELLDNWDGRINATERLVRNEKTNNKIAMYEHEVMKEDLFNKHQIDSMQNYTSNYWDLTAIPQKLSPFRQVESTTALTLRKLDLDDEKYSFCVKDNEGEWVNVEKTNSIVNRKDDEMKLYQNRMWVLKSYRSAVDNCTNNYGLNEDVVMERFGILSLPDYKTQTVWYYSDLFGMYREQEDEND